MRVNGKILDVVNDKITIQVCADAQTWILNHDARTVEVRIDDGRRITADQRRKIYATMRDIADWMGDMPDFVKAFFKFTFCGDGEHEDFSHTNLTNSVAVAPHSHAVIMMYLRVFLARDTARSCHNASIHIPLHVLAPIP